MTRPINPFDAPVPGESLTKPKGASSYETPPRYTDPNEVLSYLWKEMTAPKRQIMIIQMLKNGATAQAIAEINLFQGAAKGYFTFDLGMSIGNTLHQMVVAIAQRAIGNGKMKPEELKVHSPDREMQEFLAEMPLEPMPEDIPQEEIVEEDNILGGL